MSTKVHKDGCRITTTEFEVRLINANGDCEDIHHHETEAEAIADATSRLADGECPAIVIEKHVSKSPAHLFATPDTYKTVWRGGSEDALEAGCWSAIGETTDY